MKPFSIVSRRLLNHHLLGPKLSTAADVVAHFGAVQGQDYLYSLWALGLRTEGATEAVIEQAIADRQIVRTWPLRGTIHYVTAADARWMVRLSAERVMRAAAGRLRQLELDDDTFNRSRPLIIAALQNNKPMTRPALLKTLSESGVSTAGQRGYHILWFHAHEGLIGIGPREDKQQTSVLLDEWLPAAKELSRDEALAELARRYFTSHGPATIKDYTWWSGLAPAEARAGLEAIKSQLAQETISGEAYWFDPSAPVEIDIPSPIAHLLPFVDEYLIAYKDRTAIQRPEYNALVDSGNVSFHQPILVDGRVAGIWTRKLKKAEVVISTSPFRSLTADEEDAIATASEQYAAFLGLTAELARVS